MNTVQAQAIPLAAIKANPNNPRHVITPEMVDSMAASLKAVGLKNPIKVTANANGTYTVISGHIRLAGATQLGWESISTQVLTLSPEEAQLEAILDNRGQPMNWLETYETIESLHNLPSKPNQQIIADQLGISQKTVSRAMTILDALKNEAREYLYTNGIKSDGYQVSETTAFTLTNLKTTQEINNALKVVIEKQMTEAQAKALVTHIRSGNAPETYQGSKAPAQGRKKPLPPELGQVVELNTKNNTTTTHPRPQAATTGSASPDYMGTGEVLVWDSLAGVSIVGKIKAKINKGIRPSLFEALILVADLLWRGLVWVEKHLNKVTKPILETVWKLLKGTVKFIFKTFGRTFYNLVRVVLVLAVMGFSGWLAYDIFIQGIRPRQALMDIFSIVSEWAVLLWQLG